MALVCNRFCVKRIIPSLILMCKKTEICTAHFSPSLYFSCSSRVRRDATTKETSKSLIVKSDSLFDEAAKRSKDKATFRKAVATYLKRESQYRRGHVEFIYSALHRMKEFGCEKDLQVYKEIFQILPPDKMIALSNFQVEMQHYPKQQQCAIDLMQQMEENGVIPDNNFGDLMLKRFHKDSHAARKYRRIMYWLPKFKNLNPYPIPENLPEDKIELAKIALRRMAVDWENQITVYKTRDMEAEPSEDTFISFAQSPKQQELLSAHPITKPVFVEGGYTVWVKSHMMTYFVLIADSEAHNFKNVEENDEDLFNWTTIFEEERPKALIAARSIHEQEDGTVLSMCITGTSTKESLVSWIRYLQKTNPNLEQVPVVFRLQSPDSGIQLLVEPDKNEVMNT